jgi:hypothetical protein
VQFLMHGFAGDSEHEEQRIMEVIREATLQLRAVDAPGLVVLDADEDCGLLGRVEHVEEALRTETWARGLAAVVVLEHAVTVDEEIDEVRVDYVVEIVPGRLAAALGGTLLTGLRVCDQGHLHCDTLLAPPERCRFSG